jgi:hypothetical protein
MQKTKKSSRPSLPLHIYVVFTPISSDIWMKCLCTSIFLQNSYYSVLRWQLKMSKCHSKRGGGNGLTNQNPPLALPNPSYIPLAWHSGTEVVTSVHNSILRKSWQHRIKFLDVSVNGLINTILFINRLPLCLHSAGYTRQ